MLLRIIAVACVAAFASSGIAQTTADSYKPPRGYVPDEATAIKIAIAVWEPIYGADKIAAEKPFHATLRNGVWTVGGTLPKGYSGGTAIAEISKDDGRIIRISHGK
jgi:hypothetical protein